MANDKNFVRYIESDDALFHYTSLSTAIEYILESGKLKLSSLKDTNDPQEYKFMFLNAMAWGDILEKIQDQINNEHTVMDRQLRYDSRIGCFCTNSKSDSRYEIYAYAKSRMWSQYSDKHKGICLVFSKNEINNFIKSQIGEGDMFYAEEVEYRYKQRIDSRIKNIDGNLLDKMGCEEYTRFHINRFYKQLFFSKNHDYKDESEYRIVVLKKNGNFDYINIETLLKGIIIGDKCPSIYDDLIIKFSKKYSVNARRLYWSDWAPHLLPIEK